MCMQPVGLRSSIFFQVISEKGRKFSVSRVDLNRKMSTNSTGSAIIAQFSSQHRKMSTVSRPSRRMSTTSSSQPQVKKINTRLRITCTMYSEKPCLLQASLIIILVEDVNHSPILHAIHDFTNMCQREKTLCSRNTHFVAKRYEKAILLPHNLLSVIF